MDEFWKNRFSEYVKSAAFHLTMSKLQYQALNRLAKMEDKVEELEAREKGEKITMWRVFEIGSRLSSMTALERKGLIRHDNEGWHVTQAGRIALELVYLAFPEERDWQPRCMYAKKVESKE